MFSSYSYSPISSAEDSERSTNTRRVGIPRPLCTCDILKAARTIFNAFRDDPLYEYIQVGRPQSMLTDITFNCLRLCVWARRKLLWTIDGGTAIISIGQSDRKFTTDDRMLNWVYDAIHRHDTEEQKKRLYEVVEKTRIAINRARSPRCRFEDMLLVEILAVEPHRQGQGYGSTLLDCVLRYADLLGKRTWLHCSNIKNITFYNNHGFQTISEVILGDANPAWQRPPVIRSIMIREPNLDIYNDKGISNGLCRDS